jgi:anaphase-promoting complex subunit 2
MPGCTLDARKRRVFDSVFGGAGNISQPTPVTTPITGFTPPGEAFGAPSLPIPHSRFSSSLSHDKAATRRSFGGSDQDQVRWDRSWHIVTHTLSLPDFKESRGILEALKPEGGSVGPDFYDALEDVLYPQVCVPYARQTEDIIIWHTTQVRNHFLHQVLPAIIRARQLQTPELVLRRTVKLLETAHRQYLHGLSFIKEQIEASAPGTSMSVVSNFLRDLHAIINNSVMGPLSDCLSTVLKRLVSTILGFSSTSPTGAASAIIEEGDDSERARRDMLGLVESFKNVGLAGERFQVVFAEIMNDAMTECVDCACRGIWSSQNTLHQPKNLVDSSVLPRAAHTASPSRCVTDLCEWIENRYAKLAVQTLNLLDTKASVSWADKEKYKEIGIGRLAELRTNELFKVVGNWPDGAGALDDLRTAITTPQRRLHLTEVFAQTLSEKLLHPGASTLQILQMYISMIWSFHALDHSRVLLDRVAFPLQLYLCSREDTVRIIITGLLSEVRDQAGKLITPPEGKLYELAQILTDPNQELGQRFSDGDLDWHDMEWIPDPVDAGPGYKRSKNADIIGTLISVLGSQEVFIKEFQNIIGDSMIRSEDAFNHLKKEVRIDVYYPISRGTNGRHRNMFLNY